VAPSSSSVALTTYTVTYNANGGTGAPANQTKTQGVALTLSTTVPTRTGYTFAGWNTAANGSGTAYAAGASYTANAALTLYAQWTAVAPTTYTVTYDANGGTGAPANQTKTQDVALTLSTAVPTRTGYTFAGWNTAANGSGTAYAAGASYTANAAVTLYAQWTAASSCGYQTTYCDGMAKTAITTSASLTQEQNNTSTKYCYFLTAITDNKQGATINGNSTASDVKCCNDCNWGLKTCSEANLPAKVDGGYYVYVPGYGHKPAGTNSYDPPALHPNCR